MLCRSLGAHLCYSPMINAAIFIQYLRAHPQGSKHSNPNPHFLTSVPADRPLIVQLAGHDSELLVQASEELADRCDAVDLNLGCPQHIAKRGRYGAYLQDDWPLVSNLIHQLHRRARVPVTAKIRVFDDVQKTIAYATMLQESGCQLLTIHGRTREQRGVNQGLANWSTIRQVREHLDIPIFANGNILDLSDVSRCLEETQVDGVMVAENILHNPALFTGRQFPVWELADKYLHLLTVYPSHLSAIRSHLFNLFHACLHRHVDIRQKLAVSRSSQELLDLTRTLNARLREAARGSPQGTLRCEQHWIAQPQPQPSSPRKSS
eukprot:m.111574 g.111574  ORF g.111574 m.111574 type:complete len:321 (+) comp51827_c0_seq1:158-1120(+)